MANNEFSNNTAVQYGNDIASVPFSMNVTDLIDHYIIIAPGQPLRLEFEIKDFHGQIVKSEDIVFLAQIVKI